MVHIKRLDEMAHAHLPELDVAIMPDGTFDITTTEISGGGREVSETVWNVEIHKDHITWWEAVATVASSENNSYECGFNVEIEIDGDDDESSIADKIKTESERVR